MSRENRSKNADGSQSIARALGLLSIVADHGASGVRLSQIAELANLHIATARRILQALAENGFLAFDTRTKYYAVGPAIFSFAVKGSPWFARREVFMPVLDMVAEETRDTVLFSIRSGSEAVCLSRREGEFPVQIMSLVAGSRRPLGAGSGSLAILAFLPREEREAIIAQCAPAYGAFGLSPSDVRAMADDALALGYAFNPARIIKNVYGIAVPILVNGEAVASISVAAIAERLKPARREDIVRKIRHALSRVPGIDPQPPASKPGHQYHTASRNHL